MYNYFLFTWRRLCWTTLTCRRSCRTSHPFSILHRPSKRQHEPQTRRQPKSFTMIIDQEKMLCNYRKYATTHTIWFYFWENLCCPTLRALNDKNQGFGPAFFLRIRIRAKIFLRIRIRGVKEKMFFFSFLHVSDESEQLFKNFEKEFMKKFSAPNCLKRMINKKNICCLFSLM